MEKQILQDAIHHLEKLKTIYETVNTTKKEIRNLEEIIATMKQYDLIPAELNLALEKEQRQQAAKNQKSKPTSFSEAISNINDKQYNYIHGTKLDHEIFQSQDKIMNYWTINAKEKVLKETTALDLKLIYFQLTSDGNEPKGNKSKLYDMINSNIRARKGGIAFSKL